MHSNSHYNKRLKNYATELRTESVSRAEKYLWKGLKGKRLGVGFKRQRPILNFIVDFCSQEIGLIIEIDGNSHADKGSYDRYRQNRLEEIGFTVLRFNEGLVLQDISEVLTQIQHAVHCLKKDKEI